MKPFNRRLIALLAVLLVIFVAGCGSPSETTSETQSADTASAPAETVTPEETGEAGESPAEASEPAPAAEPDPAPEGAVLTIYGDGVEQQTDWTEEQLKELADGYREVTYSTTNNWPSYSYMSGKGVSLPYLLSQAGIKDDAQTLIFTAPDGYRAQATIGQVTGVQYSYAEHTAEGSSGAGEVEPMIAWEWGEDGEAAPENIRPLFGQLGPMDVNTAASVKDLYRIEVSTQDTGAWAEPEASVPSGGIQAGTEVELSHPQLDNVRLYYTLDGSDPTYDSEVYNKSATYYQPELIVPFVIDGDTTIKVFAGGIGKVDSPVVTLTYTVE